MSRPSSTRWDGILRVRLNGPTRLRGSAPSWQRDSWQESALVFATSAGTVGGASKSVQDLRASGAAVRAFVASGSTIYATRVHAASGAACVARVLMDVLGHSQLSITMDMYSHVMSSALLDAADAMDRALSGGR